ncbi:hypothetical protein, conserved [Angomonas deanei]|uniref:RanBP2-type domain-containing protein n=1 Tax=Angomonas deanei TaxID=59799 RepID=A0A7G2CNP6_9TRYP|nr:hypothetical protein, conserved [Angomonas deanei]
MIVDHSVSVSSKPVSTPLFCTLVNGMFTNDMFFRKATFVSMHHTLLGIVSHFTNPLWNQEVPNGQWNAMMRQWSRVYSKLGEGTRLYQSFHHLRTTISGVEDCLPAVFYVNLVGSLMDCNDHSDASGDAWRSITEVSKIGVSLYGHDSRERRTMWVVLLKAALTIYPPSEAASRLLECYQIYAEAGLPLEPEKKSFLQITRYMSESITRSTDIGGVQKLIEQYTEFLGKQEWVSFLWILDAVGVMMGDLWNSFGADGSTSAAHLIESVRQLLSSRHVSGVDLQTNPRIAKYMELYSIGDENAFWWECGCGLTLPSLAVRCVNCLRKEKASWTCVSCGANHVPPCYHQACDACGEANPRRIAAEKVSLQLCAVCGSAHAAGEACTRCGDVAKAKGLSVCCESCQTPLQGDHLYCPNCFTAVNPALCFLWHCDSCQRLNISRRSACHQCGNKRRTQCIVLPFSAWKCGCGASRSPFTRSCSQCSDGPHTYTCPCCLRVSGTTSVFFLEEYKLSVFMCTHCARPHPLDSLILGSPILARHCVQCGRRILHLSERQENLFHCGVHQPINEHVPFFCSSCHHGSAQTGYHCKDCLSPREELLSSEDTFVWRCVQEGSDSDSVCGSWNYSWQNQCRACKRGRIYTKFECRAKLSTWRCTQCAHKNNPLHVLNCEACGAFRRATVCEVCGIQHLTVDCITAV